MSNFISEFKTPKEIKSGVGFNTFYKINPDITTISIINRISNNFSNSNRLDITSFQFVGLMVLIIILEP